LRSLKWYKSLQQTSIRIEEGFFCIEGFKAVEQLLKRSPQMIDEIILDETKADGKETYPCAIRILTHTQFLSISASQTPQGVLAVVSLPSDYTTANLPLIVGERILLLEHIQDPGNVGTLIRTAAALNYSGVILSHQCADPFSPKAVQSTAGSVLSVWIRKVETYLDLLVILQNEGYFVGAAELHGSDHVDFSRHARHVIALGNEGCGLSCKLLELADFRFRIPFDSSKAESLNVAVCGAIVMFAGANGNSW
jgi:RNA methyltransferase, TrmH family